MPTRLSKNTASNKKRRPLGRCFPIRSEADIKVLCSAAHFPAGRPSARRCLAGAVFFSATFSATSFFFASAFLSAGFSSEQVWSPQYGS